MLNEKPAYEVEIERIIPRGYGIAHHDGATVFVSLAAPGDRVLVRETETKGSIVFAEIVDVVRPSPVRVTPPCPYFGTCGGCDFQQLAYADQLKAKVAIVEDCLRRIAKSSFDGEIRVIGSPRELEYRSRAQWHLDAATKGIGYYKRNSRDLIPIDACPKLVPELNAQLQRIRSEIDWARVPASRGFVEAAVGDGGRVSLNSPGIYKPEEISFKAGDVTLNYSAKAFFQGNQYLIPALLEAAIGDSTGDSALDLYCGVGLFTLPLAGRFRAVTGVEESPLSIAYARQNASQNGIKNAKFHASSVAAYLASNRSSPVDMILLDPPRAGTEKATMMRVIELGAREISYVACEPSVFARDLKRLEEAGYRLTSLTAIDLFPQTHHVETVARLIKI